MISMDVIPTIKLVGGLIAFGVTYYVLNVMVYVLVDMLNLTGDWWAAWIWLWVLLPLVVIFGQYMRYLQSMQKRTRGF